MLGRSDATLNRHGVRIGTAEIYRSLAWLAEVEDSLIVNLDLPGGKFFMPLFVKLRDGRRARRRARASDPRRACATNTRRATCPTGSIQVTAIPYTLTGKKLEVPVRRILTGVPLEKAANRDAMANPAALDFFIEYARTQRDYAL